MRHPAIVMVFAMAFLASTERGTDSTPVAFDTHDGYFVSNRFEPTAAASFVAIRDQEAFDRVFGVAMVMGDKSHRLPAKAFDSKMVVAAIKRGKAVWQFKVQEVAAEKGLLIIRYTTTSEAQATAEFACPLIVSVPKGDYSAVQFEEDGKLVKKLDLKGDQASEPVRKAEDHNAEFEITCRKRDDAIKVAVDGAKTIFSITSVSGIGGAKVERKADHWPKELVLRVHLRGLESFTISNGDTKLSASVLSHSGHPRLLHLPKDGKEGPRLEKDSPYWMDIQAFDADGKPAKGLPGNGGWFEMTIPRPLLSNQTRTLTVAWIDFYRD